VIGIIFHYGPLSEWFSGLATATAVATALYFSYRGERRSEDARLRAVYAWCERQISPGRAPNWVIVINNGTQFPIDEWRVILTWTPPGGATTISESIDHEFEGVVPPGKHLYPWVPSAQLPESDAQVKVDITFKDGSGRQTTHSRARLKAKSPRN